MVVQVGSGLGLHIMQMSLAHGKSIWAVDVITISIIIFMIAMPSSCLLFRDFIGSFDICLYDVWH